jgi:molecular chaperone HtpG
MSETFEFQAEITQLMSLIINAVYTNNDIFIRELISNASDAIDKIKYTSLTNPEVLQTGSDFYVKIIINKNAKTLSFIDTGIGMTKDDLKNNLGTIAKSGTSEFLKSLKDQKDMSMIGKFGVGFYSTYLVADSVDVYSKNNNDVPYMWSSNASSTFTINSIDTMPYDLQRGTCIVLHMKDDALEYLNDTKVKEIVKMYSQFTSYDILLGTLKSSTPKVDDIAEDEEGEDDVEDVEMPPLEETDEQPSESTETIEPSTESVIEQPSESTETLEPSTESVIEPSTESTETLEQPTETTESPTEPIAEVEEYEFTKLNEVPIWSKNHTDVTSDEYKEFYKVLTGESWQTYATHTHFHIEGNMDFTSLIFVPEKAPFDMFQKQNKKNNIKLYVRKVYITDECDELCPEWLSFVRGIVDSTDLPLTISRENFQHVKILKQISKSLVKKCIEMITNLADDVEKYNAFYKEFSKNIKLGIHEDSGNRQKLLNLLRFETSFGNNQSLSEYCLRSKENNTNIYYISGDENTVYNSPFAERCLKNGHEIVYMTDVLDEYIMQQIRDFECEGKTFKFVSLTKEGFKSDECENTPEENVEELCKYMKSVLGDNIEKVVKSERLENRPAIIVTGEYGHSARMEQIMNSQAMRANNEMHSYMKSKKTLEINPNNKIIKELNKRIATGQQDKTSTDLVTLLYESAMLVSGFTLEKPNAFVDKINRIIEAGLNLNDESDEVGEDNLVNETASIENTTSEMEQVD